MKLLTRRGYLIEEQDMIYMAETETHTAMAPLQLAACTYRIAFGPRAGQKVLTLRSVPGSDTQHTQLRCANAQGFSLYAEGALRHESAQQTQAVVSIYHSPRHRQRTAQTQPRRRRRVATQEPVSGRHHPHRDVGAGVHATLGRFSSTSQAQSDSLTCPIFGLIV